SQKVCDGNMEEGSFRCEPNLSLRPAGAKEFGTKVELKNINSFKFVKAAMEYEVKRQTKVLDEGGKIVQETRLWDTEKGETAVMRSKEEAHDYRYFLDPDLVPLRITEEMIEEARKSQQELPEVMYKRLKEECGLNDYAATVLTTDRNAAVFFEANTVTAVAAGFLKPQICPELANWIIGDLRGLQGKYNFELKVAGTTAVHSVEKPVSFGGTLRISITPEVFFPLVAMKQRGEISGPTAKMVLEKMVVTGSSAEKIVKDEGLVQVSDEGALEKIIDEVMAKNPQQLAQYRSGKEAVFGFFVGQVMKSSGGKANPAKVNDLLKRKLAS
ncbi:MAG: Asp-tRNA(Asn)/Glu-tRNA(Gln) amidotransferase GatCAB subunit B, partial [Nitrospirales bacterium]|nr:Asp-tRNA(Asn)/Glu-tRNA(Gln) amidotransferase GatCAB subunit B [Nitrospirales bacterium]